MNMGPPRMTPVRPDTGKIPRVNPMDLHIHALEELAKLVTKLQHQEQMAADKILAGQGNILNQKLKDIEEKYASFHNALRAAREYMGSLGPIEQVKSDLEKREVLVHSGRSEIESATMKLKAKESELTERETKVRVKMADLEVGRRLEELTRREKELEEKLRAYTAESEAFRQTKVEVEKLVTENRALSGELATRNEALQADVKKLEAEKENYRKGIEEDVFGAAERAFREILYRHYKSQPHI